MQCSSNSCSSGCGGHGISCPCPAGGNPQIDSLEKVVSCYWSQHQDLAVECDYYQGLENQRLAIVEAAEALGDENLGYDAPDRIEPAVLKEAARRLLSSETTLAGCGDFSALHDVVAGALAGLAGVTPALVYLTALRIGMQAGLAPEQIYLQAGAEDGAAAFAKLQPEQQLLSRESLPAVFQHPELTTEDIQACLTICRNQLRWLADQGGAGGR